MISSKIMKQIISKIAKTTIPSNTIQKAKKKIADKVYNLVEKEIQKYSEVIELEFGGSYAKDTWLSKNADIDIFIKFKKSTSEEKLESISKEIGLIFLLNLKKVLLKKNWKVFQRKLVLNH